MSTNTSKQKREDLLNSTSIRELLPFGQPDKGKILLAQVHDMVKGPETTEYSMIGVYGFFPYLSSINLFRV